MSAPKNNKNASKEVKKEATIQIRVLPEIKALWQAKAKEKNQTLTQYILQRMK